MNSLNNQWKSAKHDLPGAGEVTGSSMAQILKAKAGKKSVIVFHKGNILILGLLVVILCIFFIYVAPLQHMVSRSGIFLMISGIVLRVIIEVRSLSMYKKISFDHDASRATSESISFYRFRRQIHGPYTIAIVAAYALGYYMLLPEFSLYFNKVWIWIMAGGFAVGAVMLIVLIRTGIKNELRTLERLTRFQQDLGGE